MLDQLEELTAEDAEEARALVEEHLRRTDSPVARRVLDSWEQLLPRFVKVFPTDYKRVLAEQAAAAAEQEIAA
jgi:glutamate synthase domain-containing protein 3